MRKDKENGGIIFNIQRFSIHDGPGIRTTVFLKGCPLRCFWCQNPESQDKNPEVFFNKDRCTACGSCIAVCPNQANALFDGTASIDRDQCRGCGKCVDVCPSGARTLIGRYATVDEIVKEALRDRKFYTKSGGGVTLSGGEPAAQPEFALALLRRCKEAGLHTAIETCGYASWPTLEALLAFTDLVLYDIKCADPRAHQKATGKSSDPIRENAARIAGCRPMRIRVPLIPGFNDSEKAIRAIAHWAQTELGCKDIDLLPYNRTGENKYERLGRPLVGLEAASDERIEDLNRIVHSCLQP